MQQDSWTYMCRTPVQMFPYELATFFMMTLQPQNRNRHFLIVYFWKMWIVSWNGAFVSSMTTKLVRQRHFHESNECHPSGSELYLTMGIKYTSRGMWPEATQGSELIWLQNRGPVNWNLLFNVFNDRASQNNTCANNTQAHSQATLWILHFRE